MVSSRLARKEQSRALRQTILYVVIAGVLVVSFIFLIVPNFLRLVTFFQGGETEIGVDDSLPPQVPVISAPPTATSSSEVKLNGFAEAKSELVVVLDGNEHSRQTVGDNGEFEISLNLEPGTHALTTYAIDGAGNESNVSRSYSITYDNEPPKLEIAEPTEGQQIVGRANQTANIKGTTEVGARLTVNGRLVSVTSDGSFVGSYQLAEGDNKLELVAEDQAGHQTKKTLSVSFRP